MKKMKILQVITIGHELYGAQKHVLDLCVLLKKNGHEVMVATGTAGTLTDLLDEESIPFKIFTSLVHPINPGKDVKFVKDLISFLKTYQPDLVASHSSKAGLLSRIACRRAKMPNTFTSHGWSFEGGIPFVKRMVFLTAERAAGRISDGIITVAEAGREYGLQKKVAKAAKIVTIHNGVEDIAGQYEKVKNDRFTITMVAGLRPQKDHFTLIEALGKVKHLDWEVFFLGDGPLMEVLSEKTTALDLTDRIHFKGAVSNVGDYLCRSHLLTLITNWEGFPISILEGLSFGLPILATDVAGVKEQVIDDYNGITVPPKDIDAVANALELMMKSPEKLAEMGRNSRELFEQRFTREAMYKKTVALYYNLINKA